MQSYFNHLRNLSYRKATLPALFFLALGSLLSTSVQALGTDADVSVVNSVSLTYQVNTVNQTASTSVAFEVDRKLVLDVTAGETDWVSVLPGQDVTTVGASLPALNFTVTNSSNDATDIVLGLIDQDGNVVTGFPALATGGTAFANTPGAVVVAIDVNADGIYTEGADTLLTVGTNGVYTLGNLAADGIANVLVAISVDSAEDSNAYRSYTLVAGIASAPGVPAALDQSGNIAPASGATPDNAINDMASVETVWADAGAPLANLDDEQFDFFSGTTGLTTVDGVADGQSSDASGFITRATLALAKTALVLYDPITGNRYNADRVTVDAEPKSIPGAVIMYVIAVANESAGSTANGVALSDTLPTQVAAGNTGLPTPAVVIPSTVSVPVGSLTLGVDLSALTLPADLNDVSFLACSTPTANPDYNGAFTIVAGDVGNCAATETAYVVYFVTLN